MKKFFLFIVFTVLIYSCLNTGSGNIWRDLLSSIACAIMMVGVYRYCLIPFDQPSEKNIRSFGAPALAAHLSKKEEFKPQAGQNIHLNGVQFEIKAVAYSLRDATQIIRIDIVPNQKNIPRVPVSLAWPSMMPYGGNEYEQNFYRLKKIFKSKIDLKVDDNVKIKCEECGCNPASGNDCMLSNCPNRP